MNAHAGGRRQKMDVWSPYRGYLVHVLDSRRVQIRMAGDLDVICTEDDIESALAVIDGWLAAR